MAISVDLFMLRLADIVSPSRLGISATVLSISNCDTSQPSVISLCQLLFFLQYWWPFESLSTSTLPAKER